MHSTSRLDFMRTTVNLDDALLAEARRLTRIEERTALLHEALRALIARESARRLARLSGSEPQLRSVPRRQSRRR
jgi:Arc/MetJ family transcription regulator